MKYFLLSIVVIALTSCSLNVDRYPSGKTASLQVSVLQNINQNKLVAYGDAIPGDSFVPMPIINNPAATDAYQVPSSLPTIPGVILPIRKQTPATFDRDYYSSQSLGQVSYVSNRERYSGFVMQTRSNTDTTPANGFVRNAGWAVAAGAGTYNLTKGIEGWIAK